jgi:FkbM family methyltransferase
MKPLIKRTLHRFMAKVTRLSPEIAEKIWWLFYTATMEELLIMAKMTRLSPGIASVLFRNELCYNALMENMLRTLDVRIVIDVGANRGEYRGFLRNIGFKGLIVSFEPIKARAAYLKQRSIEDGRWMVYDMALGAQDGIADFNVMKSDDFSSFHEPLHDQISFEGNVIDHVERVAVKRLDGMIRQINSPGNIFLKLDTQGYDLEVIKGVDNFNRIVLIQSEFSLIPIYKTMPSMIEAIPIFQDLGYAVAGMFPVTKDALHRVIEFDCLLVRCAEKLAERAAPVSFP